MHVAEIAIELCVRHNGTQIGKADRLASDIFCVSVTLDHIYI